jgi:ribonuclease HI
VKRENQVTTVYTDGSCNPVEGIGAWAAIIFSDGEKVFLSGSDTNTTHQAMELMAALKSFEYILSAKTSGVKIRLHTDSQYLVNLPKRKEKLEASALRTKNQAPVRNAELIRVLFSYLAVLSVTFIKVTAHQRSVNGENYNREVDRLSRKIVRDSVRNTGHKND